jgi:uncharacterized membrane protein
MMSFQPLLSASWAIHVHVATLVLAFVVGTWQFLLSRKGAPAHRASGKAFLVLMLVMAASSLFIHVAAPHNLLGLSVLHLYVPLVLGLVAMAWYGAATHRRRMHLFAVIALYFGSLIFTGIVQIFLADGITHRMFFPQ